MISPTKLFSQNWKRQTEQPELSHAHKITYNRCDASMEFANILYILGKNYIVFTNI